MHRSSPDHFRRPVSCPRCPGQPMIALPDFYLELMFGELPAEQSLEAAKDDVDAKSSELAA